MYKLLKPDSNCHKDALKYICSAGIPSCKTSKERLDPCSIFCKEIVKACIMPMECRPMPNDFDPRSCEIDCKVDASNSWWITFDKNNDYSHYKWIEKSDRTYYPGPISYPTRKYGYSYYYLDGSMGKNGVNQPQIKTAKLHLNASKSILINETQDFCFRFYYFLSGTVPSGLKLYILRNHSKSIDLWLAKPDRGQKWNLSILNISLSATDTIVFLGYSWKLPAIDMALDGLSLSRGICPNTGSCNDKFDCGNGQCIENKYVCDRINTCGNFLDEILCNCSKDEYKCKSGICIDRYRVCDEHRDCHDGDDEKNCDKKCSKGGFKCPNGDCIPHELICDGVDDCISGWDEKSCSVCSRGEFQCKNTQCIPISGECDRKVDCADGSDEQNCFKISTDEDIFMIKAYPFDWIPLCHLNISSLLADQLCMKVKNGYMKNIDWIVYSSHVYVTISECGESGENIVSKGQIRDINWPWTVPISFDAPHLLEESGPDSCTATFIDQYFAVTAAHCIIKDSNTIENIKIKRVIIHPNYSSFAQGYDIAILETIEPAGINSVLCLRKLGSIEGIACEMVGWRLSNLEEYSEKLRTIRLMIWNNRKCLEAYPWLEKNNSSLCAGYESALVTPCHGDSGLYSTSFKNTV
ncbi:DgyrCDS6437 [Dimorphilus gyrociliatus]|uniref:DgyrCDS6437 n=1 Tax=Dimorphilus gyrociliatus TaxID=2664684 RepID=A0A7I8VNR6_9ANNE|nr:DgyrCDS6437 [Dimorphilus gyrociliatus]